jgi:hypothetical protein
MDRAYSKILPPGTDKLGATNARWRGRMVLTHIWRRTINGPKHSVTSTKPTTSNEHGRKGPTHQQDGSWWGFYIGLIRLALIRQINNGNVYISARKSMTVCFYTHSIAKRAEGVVLVDSGATENFMNLQYTKWLRLPVKRLAFERNLFNVDGTENKSGKLKYYIDLEVQMGSNWTRMRFFLTDLGEHKAILGYLWFAVVQLKIDWKRGWIDESHLPIILQIDSVGKAKYLPKMVNVPRPLWPKDKYYLGKVTIGSVTAEEMKGVPDEYKRHLKVFSEKELQHLPQHTVWDHAIKLLPGAPSMLLGWLLPLTEEEIEEVRKFIKEHLEWNTIRPSWSPYTTNFFFMKKKDGKLWPMQNYHLLNKWTKRNRNVLPLIPSIINWLTGCTLFTKFNIWWGYNNICIKPGDEWKAAFLTPEGLFEPTVMFFGLTNLPATFQMMMNTIFRWEVQEGWFLIFMDNGIIYTKWQPGKTKEQHRQWHWELVHHIFNILEQHNLYIKPEKCAFEQEEMEYLGIIMGKGKTWMDLKKLMAVASYPKPQNTTDIHAFLGFMGYYCYFILSYSQVVRPLLDLTKKMTPWAWGPKQDQAFTKLKALMCVAPVLTQPDFNKKFYLQTDASGYGMGAILLQEGAPDMLTLMMTKQTNPILHPIAYYSATFTPTEQNYDVYNHKLLAIMKALVHWWQYLGWTKVPFTIIMDHANLQHWKSPQNLVWWVARWHIDLQEYDYESQYIPEKENTPPDTLSRQPGVDKGQDNNQGIVIIPPEKFKITQVSHITPKGKVHVPPIEEVKRGIMNLVHNHLTAGHPGQDEMIRETKKHYYWPGMEDWIEAYVNGCAICQQNKILMHQKKTPTYWIPTKEGMRPFQRVVMDLITGLPPMKDKDAILTIVDQGCSWVAIFLPCNMSITGSGVTQLYHDHIYWWFRLPTKIISDKDPWFTSHFSQAFTKRLGIEQNMSMAFHPQMDGLSKHKNQWLEQYLRLVTLANPKDWTRWLALASAVHNNRKNATTRLSPNQILLGYKPNLNPKIMTLTKTKSMEERYHIMMEKQVQAIAAINQAAEKKGRPEA